MSRDARATTYVADSADPHFRNLDSRLARRFSRRAWSPALFDLRAVSEEPAFVNALNLVRLPQLMDVTRGRSDVRVGLIDGPVLVTHPDLAGTSIVETPGTRLRRGAVYSHPACLHGTLVAGILFARRGSPAPAICPDCTLVIRPVFGEATPARPEMPSATPEDLAQAIVDCVDGDARLLNLSVALVRSSPMGRRELGQALDYASSRGSICVAAAGNQGEVGSSIITRHPSVLPVAACDLSGSPLRDSNLGGSIGRRGYMAPGVGVTSLGVTGMPRPFRGTSAATPFVTGAIALIWSEFPAATATDIRLALQQSVFTRHRTITPPVLDAWGAYQALQSIHRMKGAA